MTSIRTWIGILTFATVPVFALQEAQPKQKPSAGAVSITIYNQDFAVVKQAMPIRLKAGENEVDFADVTEQVEPESVMLRDATGKHAIQIIEQNYSFETASQGLLLSQFEGKTIDFKVQHENSSEIVQGKIIRSGFLDRSTLIRRFGPQYIYNAAVMQPNSPLFQQPLIEVNGKLQFALPGLPLFPSLPVDDLLKPSLNWKIASANAADFDAEVSYVTGGMVWQADYNVVAPQEGDALDLLGWVTLDNHTGKAFENASVQLMAGDVNKLKPNERGNGMGAGIAGGVMVRNGPGGAPPVTERTFDDYHLYSLSRPVTLKNRETKQVEFLRASKIPAKRLYVFDGFRLDPQVQAQGYQYEYLRQNRDYGASSNNTKVWIMKEFTNSQENNLGVPLPKGRMRFYRRDAGGRMEFIGENDIDHTPKGETVRVYTGNAFDITGERKRSNFRMDGQRESAEESFEIKVRNHKKEAIQVTVVEHMYRGYTWEVTSHSAEFQKKDSQTIEFAVDIPPDGEQKVLYTVHYSW